MSQIEKVQIGQNLECEGKGSRTLEQLGAVGWFTGFRTGRYGGIYVSINRLYNHRG